LEIKRKVYDDKDWYEEYIQVLKDGKEIHPITEEIRQNILEAVSQLNEQGLRVLGVSQKFYPNASHRFAVEDESNMILMGYLAFLDPPKPSAAPAIKALAEYGVTTKILTGDNEKVTQAVCEKVGLPVDKVLLGTEIEDMSDEELAAVAEETTIFAKLSPEQKARIIHLLKAKGHKIGYMGDGINDAPALVTADIGFAIGSGTDIAVEAADIVLVRNDLHTLVQAVRLSRKTMTNIKQNLFWALIFNCIGIPLAAIGALNPMIAGTAMAFSSVTVVSNSLRLKRAKI